MKKTYRYIIVFIVALLALIFFISIKLVLIEERIIQKETLKDPKFGAFFAFIIGAIANYMIKRNDKIKENNKLKAEEKVINDNSSDI